ncbi:hypothetical protein [Rhodococcus aetherivorans]|uniref:hypothetical protein n=1 Tax=Rhodococcus aetherivorans TaxID=191292 RepID=UPI001E3D6E6B|nr:hypothetical protein [Rhodococcus aetherivorans]UGQ42141.1 hypothetical protein LRQ66_02065 [Rhodococcus aetherivorans]
MFDIVKTVERSGRQIEGVVRRVVERTGSHPGPQQTVTIGAPRETVQRFWREPANLSQVFGERTSVAASGPDRLRWTFELGADPITWETRVLESDGELQFVATDAGDSSQPPRILLSFATAPHGLGTEVSMRADTPVPGLITGAATFTALYRARALLQTGEMPTLRCNPSARGNHSARGNQSARGNPSARGNDSARGSSGASGRDSRTEGSH